MYREHSGEQLRLTRGVVMRAHAGTLLVLGPDDPDVVEITGAAAALLRGADRGTGSDPGDRDMFPFVAQLLRRGWVDVDETHSASSSDEASTAITPRPETLDSALHSALDATARLVPSPDLPADAWLRHVEHHRVTVLAHQVGARDSAAVPAGADAALATAARARIAWSMIAERAGLQAVDRLRSNGVPCIVLKGMATAHLDYPDPALRELGDVDLLVAAPDVGSADELLMALAVRRESVDTTLRLRNKERVYWTQSDVEVDLHHRLLEDPFGRAVDVDALLQDSIAVHVAGIEIRTLDAPHRLAHAVAHWASSGFECRRNSGLVDVALLSADPDVAAQAREVLASWSLGCLADIVDELPGQPMPDRAQFLGRLFRRASRGSRLAAEFAAVVAEPSLAAKGRSLWSRLVPNDELMGLHGVSRPYRLVRFAVQQARPQRRAGSPPHR